MVPNGESPPQDEDETATSRAVIRQAVRSCATFTVSPGTGNICSRPFNHAATDLGEHINAALRRLGYSKDEATTHGFRSTAAVRLNETRQWSADAIERQLAHQEANSVRRAYTHAAEFWPERREMMQVWADQLDQWREGAKVTEGPQQV